MAVTNFKPEIWSSVLLEAEKKSLVFTSLCNRDYEGDVKNAGESVRITSVGRPTVNNYTGSVTYEDVDAASSVMALDQNKYIAFKVDDVDRAQAAGNFWTSSMEEGAYQLADAKDQLIAGLYTASGNTISAHSATNGATAMAGLVKIVTELNEANVPQAGRWTVLPPWYYALLLAADSPALETQKYGNSDPIQNGFIGRLLGLDLYVSNNVVLITGDDYAVMAGTKRCITFADQLLLMEAGRAENFIGDWVRSLTVYGAKVVKADGLVVLTASQT
jgi:hypothetical protein